MSPSNKASGNFPKSSLSWWLSLSLLTFCPRFPVSFGFFWGEGGVSVWIVNDPLWIIDGLRYQPWIMHWPLKHHWWETVSSQFGRIFTARLSEDEGTQENSSHAVISIVSAASNVNVCSPQSAWSFNKLLPPSQSVVEVTWCIWENQKKKKKRKPVASSGCSRVLWRVSTFGMRKQGSVRPGLECGSRV